MKAKVAFIKTDDRTRSVEQVIDLLNQNPVSGKKVLLKPNFNSADPTPGSTHPDFLKALVNKLNAMGASHITIADRSGMGDTHKAMEDLGILELAREMGIDTLAFDDLGENDWLIQQPEGSHWQSGFPFARPVLEAESVVQTCCLKTHQFGGHFTLSLKNAVGMVARQIPNQEYNYMKELHGSPHQRLMIAEINTAYTPDLIIMDAIEAFISGGPHQGEKAQVGAVYASTDRIAIDAIGVALLRMHGCKTEVANGMIFEQEQIKRAVELGLGVNSPDRIEFITSDAASKAYSEEIKSNLFKG